MIDRRQLWPDLDEARVRYEDEHTIVVDKPAGVPSQASEQGATDDLVSRLRSFIATRDRVDEARVYLGVHQRLDRATSGVLVHAKKKEANRGLAAQFERRTVEKTYVAAVENFRPRERTTLRHRLASGPDGNVIVVDARDRRGQEAITHATPIERQGARTLVELRLETGRTHQARAQLAAIGAPIGGDRLYDGPPAPRLMLHARSIAYVDPKGSRVEVSSTPPRAFARWLARGDASPLAGEVDREALDDAIDLAREERFGLGRASMLPTDGSGHTTAFRLVNEGGDAIPGVAVDVYGDHLVAQLYDDDAVTARETVLDALDALGFEGIYLKLRPKQANTLVDARNETIAPSTPVRGARANEEIEVREHGVPYLARLGDGLSTGIFLDQRENRRRVRAMVAGKSVLNLFAYTCPFTVAAASGGAARTVSVDAARPAIERGKRGLVHAGLDGDHHEVVVDDVFAFLDKKKTRDRFDLVILDPPSYSSVGSTRFSTASDYRPLAAKAMALVAKDGFLLACSNHRQTVRAKLRRLLHEAARDAGRTVVQMKDLPHPIDYPAPHGREPHLKSILVRLA